MDEVLKINQNQKVLIWLPRIITICLTILLLLFVLEGFRDNFKWYLPVLVFAPGLIYLFSVVIAWRWSKIGGVLFVIWGLVYSILYLFRVENLNVMAFVVLGVLPLIAGILFLGQEKS